jgi:hypothetical protein
MTGFEEEEHGATKIVATKNESILAGFWFWAADRKQNPSCKRQEREIAFSESERFPLALCFHFQ